LIPDYSREEINRLVGDFQPQVVFTVMDLFSTYKIAWRYARDASVSWFGGHAPVRQRQFTCVHADGNATVLDLDNRLINGVQVSAEEPLKREWRYAMNLDATPVPLWPEVEVLEAAEKMAARELVAA
jgi:hypothetical protein